MYSISYKSGFATFFVFLELLKKKQTILFALRIDHYALHHLQ